VVKMEESNIGIYQKDQQTFNRIGVCKFPANEDLRHLFKHYEIDTYLKIKLPEGFNPENAKKRLWIQRIQQIQGVQLNEDIKVNETLLDLYPLMKDSKLKTPRTKKTIGDSLFESLENCLSLNNKEHETPKNLIDKQVLNENYMSASKPKEENYLLIKYIIPEIEKKIETIKELVKSLDVKNPKIDQKLYGLDKSKPSLTNI